MYRNLLIVIFIGLISLVFVRNSIAEPQKKEDQQYSQNSDWSVRLGAMGMYKPKYEGSEDYELQGFPIIDVTWRNRFFLIRAKAWGLIY